MQHFYHDKKFGDVEFEISRQQNKSKPLDKNEIYLLNTPKNQDGTEAMHGEEWTRLQIEIAHDINIGEGFVQVEGRGGKMKWVKA